ncbi:hypothetical protein ACK8HX_03650 [Oryzobacter sp. R7]|uniref:hypothetical protein n=1 Tax=Oryzobacter faecalis TaxID=3388656 RepID=UPI00398CF151
MADLDHLLHPDVAEAAAGAAQPPAFADVERRGVGRRRRRRAVAVAATAAALAVVVLVGRPWLPGWRDAAPLVPAGPSATAGTPDPQHFVEADDGGVPAIRSWQDPADTAEGYVDIRLLEAGGFGGGAGRDWRLTLAGPYPSETTLDAQGRVVEYGMVFDADADLVPDCELGISNDNATTTEPGDFRVWVRSLRTGRVAERVGGPYGLPFDFAHPEESRDEPEEADNAVTMSFFFLGGGEPPCTGGNNLYAWAEVRENGRVIARDVAPDSAWLRVG